VNSQLREQSRRRWALTRGADARHQCSAGGERAVDPGPQGGAGLPDPRTEPRKTKWEVEINMRVA